MCQTPCGGLLTQPATRAAGGARRQPSLADTAPYGFADEAFVLALSEATTRSTCSSNRAVLCSQPVKSAARRSRVTAARLFFHAAREASSAIEMNESTLIA